VFRLAVQPKSRPPRSQSVHSSEEVPETGWSEGTQEGGGVRTESRETRPAPVLRYSGAMQAGEVRARWAWSEPAVWTERMLTALERGNAFFAAQGLFSMEAAYVAVRQSVVR
jgi:hypothetical protein